MFYLSIRIILIFKKFFEVCPVYHMSVVCGRYLYNIIAKFRFVGDLLWRRSAQGFPRGEAVTAVADSGD